MLDIEIPTPEHQQGRREKKPKPSRNSSTGGEGGVGCVEETKTEQKQTNLKYPFGVHRKKWGKEKKT